MFFFNNPSSTLVYRSLDLSKVQRLLLLKCSENTKKANILTFVHSQVKH